MNQDTLNKIGLAANIAVSVVSPLLPSIIQLLQRAHPIPPDAPAAVKDDLNALKAKGALDAATVLVNQFATAGKVPAAATDPSVQAALIGALEQTYQALKASGLLDGGSTAPPVAVAPVAVAQAQAVVSKRADVVYRLPAGSSITIEA